MVSEDQINPAKKPPVFMWPCLMDHHRQAAMFVFPGQCGPADWRERKEKTERRGMTLSRNTMSCARHLLPIGKVVRHSSVGTQIYPRSRKKQERKTKRVIYRNSHSSAERKNLKCIKPTSGWFCLKVGGV